MELSPTGTPVLPVWISPWIAALTALSSAIVAVVPSHTILYKVCLGILGLGGSVASLSAGWRK